MNREAPSLSVVIPAWNEALRLSATLDRIAAYLDSRSPDRWEIVVVSDGSDDGTDASVEARGDGRIRLLRHARRRGKGAAVRTGVLDAQGDRVLMTDADLATPIDDLEKLADALDAGADVAIASRRLEGSHIERDQGTLRRFMGRFFPELMQTATGLPYADTQCGFKLFTKDAAQRLFDRLVDEGFAFDVEILCRAREEELRVDEVPVRWESREGSKVSTLGDPLRMTGALLRLGGRLDLPGVVEHQTFLASACGAICVILTTLVALLLTSTPPIVDIMSITLLPALAFLIGRELSDRATGAIAALLVTATPLYLASSLPPSNGLFQAVLAHGALAAFLVGRHKPAWWLLLFACLAGALHVGGLPLFVLAAVGPLAVTVTLGTWDAWRRRETLVGLGLLCVIAGVSILTHAPGASARLLPPPCTDAYGRHAQDLSIPLLTLLGTLPATLLLLTRGRPRRNGAEARPTWRLPLLLWSTLPVIAAATAAWAHACSLLLALGGLLVVLAAGAAAATRAGRLRAGGTTLLLAPALVGLGLAVGTVARVDGIGAALPWALAGVCLVALAAVAASRFRSVPLVLLLLALTTLVGLGAAYAAGWIPLGA